METKISMNYPPLLSENNSNKVNKQILLCTLFGILLVIIIFSIIIIFIKPKY
jgi:hypothetical protein